MTNFNAFYYDGMTSARTPVQVHQLGENLHIFGEKVTLKVSIDKIRADSRIGSVRRRLGLPGGAQLQTDDQAAIAALFPNTNRLESLVHRLEQRWPYIVAAMAAHT